VGVVGAGAVGGALAALLARGGHDVAVAARGETLAAIRADGILLSGKWGEYRAAVACGPLLAIAPDLAIVATKAADAMAAAADNARFLTGIPVAVVQNGLDAIDGTRRVIPDSTLIGGLAVFAASLIAPGQMMITTAGPIYLGIEKGDRERRDRDRDRGNTDAAGLELAASILGAVLPVVTVADFRAAQWTKLVVNQVNALPAITGWSAQRVIGDRRLRYAMTTSMQETVRIGHASGIRFASLQGLADRTLRLFAAIPAGLGQALPALMSARMGSVPNPGSTLQSVRRGQLTEIDALNGAVVRAAAAAGVSAPVNAALTAMVHEVERTGRFLTVDEIVARLG